jgi:hypothetical protein
MKALSYKQYSILIFKSQEGKLRTAGMVLGSVYFYAGFAFYIRKDVWHNLFTLAIAHPPQHVSNDRFIGTQPKAVDQYPLATIFVLFNQ